MAFARVFLAFISMFAALLLQSCNACFNQPSNPQQVREATANATAEIKNDAKAVAEGVRDGVRRPASDQPLDLNSASKVQLRSLPGMTDTTVDRIVEGRPYTSTHQLIDKRIVSPAEYDRIADRITVK